MLLNSALLSLTQFLSLSLSHAACPAGWVGDATIVSQSLVIDSLGFRMTLLAERAELIVGRGKVVGGGCTYQWHAVLHYWLRVSAESWDHSQRSKPITSLHVSILMSVLHSYCNSAVCM